MKHTMGTVRILFIIILCIGLSGSMWAQKQPCDGYLVSVKEELEKKWPDNRTINLVFHGHSVPSGYYTGGVVHRLDSYPFMAMQSIKEQYSYAVINTITTSIGGEHSEQGAARFAREVLPHQPDVLFIDYALNDRAIGLSRAKKAWEKMITLALQKNIKVILLTPTPDTNIPILKEGNVLEKHSEQIRGLAEKYQVGLVDSYQAFRKLVRTGETLDGYMAQANHPNKRGHAIVAKLVTEFFEDK